MKLNAIHANENLVMIFRADKELNEDTAYRISHRQPADSEYIYEVEKEDYYLRNKNRIDFEIEYFGNSFFNLSNYKKNEKGRREAIKKAMADCGLSISESN